MGRTHDIVLRFLVFRKITYSRHCLLAELYATAVALPPRLWLFHMLESTLTKKIQKALKEAGWWSRKISGGPRQAAGLPDLICGKDGVCIFLEVKTQTGRVSDRQNAMMNEIENEAGIRCEVVRSAAEAIAAVDS